MKKTYVQPTVEMFGYCVLDVLNSASTLIDVGFILGEDNEVWR